jgi:hypothetical protein
MSKVWVAAVDEAVKQVIQTAGHSFVNGITGCREQGWPFFQIPRRIMSYLSGFTLPGMAGPEMDSGTWDRGH